MWHPHTTQGGSPLLVSACPSHMKLFCISKMGCGQWDLASLTASRLDWVWSGRLGLSLTGWKRNSCIHQCTSFPGHSKSLNFPRTAGNKQTEGLLSVCWVSIRLRKVATLHTGQGKWALIHICSQVTRPLVFPTLLYKPWFSMPQSPTPVPSSWEDEVSV